MLHIRKAAAYGLTVLLLTTAARAEDLSVEVYSNWVSGGESAALNAIAAAFEAKGGKWIDSAVPGDSLAPAITRIVAGNPMGAAKFNTGTDLDELYKAGLLSDVDQVAADQKWQARLPDFVWNAITRDGHVYAVPINAQSEVWLWYSKPVFQKLDLQEPKTYDELFAELDKIKAAGIIPFAVGGQAWQLNILFNKILVGVAPEAYLGMQTADFEAAIESDGFKKAAEIFGRLRAYDDEGSPGRQWNVAANMVATGQAAMMVMGDWVKGEFSAAGKKPGVDYGCMLGPQNDAVILSGDAFIFPKLDAQRPGQLLLASVMLDQATQVAFNKAKGSMPSILDADVSQMDECTRKAMAVLQNPAKRVPANSYILSADRRQGMQNAITQYWSNEGATPESLVNAMLETFHSTN
ncbi:ABC transporter substrate-binding protein (plasmid) [Agrobacterium leguminum]|uniref:Probable sugar-binding periplasmic protein n=1 Tax=Agrobacterium deltaense NCPPB 1641 TaxID=1183425 RepID=A0A1S7UBZ5_9HYPH|nr:MULTISPECIES: ABC transporter substrate-binding protein [Agrobacterium]WFS69780.1 ABC transporter substrate-binding protein [Agrobacterium leguminum]CVI64101.1 ABC-type sugar transport system, periplasmic component [Agrobacterium deltaense NCPPB 1641]